MICIDREPAVAGSFYPSDRKELTSQLKSFFSECILQPNPNVGAIIVPHAGYIYSGKVAASAYSHIPRDTNYENIFIIGSSHHVAFNGASIYNKGHYKTPLGNVQVNINLANELIKSKQHFCFNQAAHSEEHTIEVQLPFLQHHLKTIKNIVPIIIGSREQGAFEDIANALKPYFNAKNLFVISTDFSHYPKYEDALDLDRKTTEAICSNKLKYLKSSLKQNEKADCPNLYTSLCGWSAVYTLMYLTKDAHLYRYKKIKYMNSGDAAFHDKNRVVGYQSILVERTETDENLISDSDKEKMLTIAKNAINTRLSRKKTSGTIDPPAFKSNSAFVSVYIKNKLRGCIGEFDSNKTLADLIAANAVSAAFTDKRFPSIEQHELNDLNIEISVLTPMKKIKDIHEIILGKHGVYLKKDWNKGTFLPQVATKTGWDIEEFLGHLARDKANIGWEGWRHADIYIYEAIVFSDNK